MIRWKVESYDKLIYGERFFDVTSMKKYLNQTGHLWLPGLMVSWNNIWLDSFSGYMEVAESENFIDVSPPPMDEL